MAIAQDPSSPSEEVSKLDISQVIHGELCFLAADPLYQTEKPYVMFYPPQGDLKQMNLVTDRRTVAIRSLHGLVEQIDFDTYGFGFMRMSTRMRYEDFDDRRRIDSVYHEEICGALKEKFGARHVYVIDSVVRKRHPSFPVSTGGNFKHEQPTSIAHIDYTQEEAERTLRRLYGSEADSVLKGRYQVINVWRPIRGTVRDWPLAVCSASTVDSSDAVPTDIVYPQSLTENAHVQYNKNQEWYYLPDQEVDQCWLFKSADSAMKAGGQCPHTAFADPNTMSDDEPRESIDCRAFVLYADLDPFPSESDAALMHGQDVGNA